MTPRHLPCERIDAPGLIEDQMPGRALQGGGSGGQLGGGGHELPRGAFVVVFHAENLRPIGAGIHCNRRGILK